MTGKIVVRVIIAALWGFTFCVYGCTKTSFDGAKRLEQAEQLFRQGISSNNNSQYTVSTDYLKQAEEVLLNMQESEVSVEQWAHRNNLLGLTWYRLGNSSESEMLYSVAQAYYRKAIPMLVQDTHTMYLACAYRDVARTIAITGGEQDSVLWYFDRAERFARTAQSDLLVLDIEAYRYQLCYPDSVAQRLAVCKQLTEEYNVYTRYSEIVELLLSQQATDSAAYYLERLQPGDSSYTYWFEQTYAYLHSKILCQQGHYDTAYAVLLDLYDRKIEELQSDASSRTYAISQHYDVEREQKKAEEAQRERRWHQRIAVVAILALVVTILLLINLYLYYRVKRREQATQLQALRDKYVQQLQLALERLRQKVSLTKEIELQRMRGNEVEFPKWLQTYRDEKLVMNKESIDELIASIDKALDGAVSRLRAEFPALTESDMQYAILSIIGATDNDMSIVLNVQKQTIYHRRQIVRKHVCPDTEDIDAWLRRYVLGV